MDGAAEIIETLGDLARAFWERRGEVATGDVTRVPLERREARNETAREGTR